MANNAAKSRFQPMSAADLRQVAGGANACCTTNFFTAFSNIVTAAAPLETAIEKATCCNPCVVNAVNAINALGAAAGALGNL